jgi:hypothetical protein
MTGNLLQLGQIDSVLHGLSLRPPGTARKVANG